MSVGFPTIFGVAMFDIDEGAVLGAIELLDDPTQTEFLDSLHFKSATHYRLVHEGRIYDSKAVAGIAHGVATGQFWTSDDLIWEAFCQVGRVKRRPRPSSWPPLR
jgi:hypothetical protein